MRRTIGLLSAVTALAIGTASAQSLRPGTPHMFRWTPEQQAEWYPAIETLYRSATVKRGDYVHPLPKADRTLTVRYKDRYGNYRKLDDHIKAYNVSGLMVVKDGKVLLERYGLGRKPEDRWISFSVTKSFTSTLVGAAIQDGKIRSLDDPVTQYIPQLAGSAYEGVKLRQLLTMSSGVRWNESYSDPDADVARYTTAIQEPGVNPIVSYMRSLPRAKTGTTFNYNSGETDLVGIVVSNAVGRSLSQYASEKLWQAYGMERDATWMTDLAGHERGGCCLSMTLGDYARFGQFMLDGGIARGRQVLPTGWIAQATSRQITYGWRDSSGYGYFWWVGQDGAYDASGIFGQSITVIPDERLVIVINSAWPKAVAGELSAARSAFINAVRAAAKGL